jgi:hypothetical protein
MRRYAKRNTRTNKFRHHAFKEVLRLRKSCRGFLDTGDKLKELSEALLNDNNTERFSPDAWDFI